MKIFKFLSYLSMKPSYIENQKKKKHKKVLDSIFSILSDPKDRQRNILNTILWDCDKIVRKAKKFISFHYLIKVLYLKINNS